MKIEFSLGQLTSITGLKTNELAELLKGEEEGTPLENAPGVIADIVSKRITKIKDAEFNTAKRKVLESIESIVKAAGIKEFDGAEDAVRQLAEAATEKGQTGDSPDLLTLTPSQLAKIPAFQAFKEAKEAEFSTLKADHEKTVKAQKSYAVAAKAKEQALSLLTEKNAKFTTPDKQLNALFKLIGVESLDLDDKGNIVVLDQNGEPRIDAHHNKVSFDDLIIGEWEPLFGFNAIDPNKKTPQPAAGNNKPNQQSTGIIFDSYEAAVKATKSGNDADRLAAQRAMNAQFPNGKPK